jgi:hypothetical protein
LKDITRKLHVTLRRWRDLSFVLIEVKRGIELRLAREQVLRSRFVIEGLVGLRLIIGEVFLHARAALLFVIREFVESAQ